MNHTLIHALHIIIFGPLLLAIGLGYLAAYPYVVITIGAGIILYHSFRFYRKYNAGAPYWTNLIHILLVGPALIAEGSLSNPPTWLREVILMFAFAAIGWHGYKIYEEHAT